MACQGGGLTTKSAGAFGLAIAVVIGGSALALAHPHFLSRLGVALPVVGAPNAASSSTGVRATSPSTSAGGPPSASTSPPGTAAANAVAARVDPAVVDINVTFPGNDGGASGTGMILTSNGLVLTNNHVVEQAATISIHVVGQSQNYLGRVIGVDPTADVALVRMEGASHLHTVSISSLPATVGEAVIAIGNALGKGGLPTVTSGAVVQLGETITATNFRGGTETLTNMIQMSAALAPGDSGGPLVTTAGKVLGMDTAASGSKNGSGFSTTAFSIPIERAMAIVHQIERHEASKQVLLKPMAIMGILGVAPSQWLPQFGPIDHSIHQGAAVENVETGTPAAGAGLAPGDIITTFQGKTVTSPSQLEQLEMAYVPGDRVTVGWVTPSGSSQSTSLRLTAGPWA